MKYLMKHAPDHLCLFKFLKRLADHYLSESRAEKFVLDLIVLDVPELFATGQDDEHEEVKAQFDGYLRDYVRRIPNAQKSALLAQMSGNMVSYIPLGLCILGNRGGITRIFSRFCPLRIQKQGTISDNNYYFPVLKGLS